MASPSTDWKDDVLAKVVKEYGSHPESITRVLHYLDEEEHACKGTAEKPPVWTILNATLDDNDTFKKTIECVMYDMRTTIGEHSYRTKIYALHQEMMETSDKTGLDRPDHLPPEDHSVDPLVDHDQGHAPLDESLTFNMDEYDYVCLDDFDIAKKSSFAGLARVWNLIGPGAKAAILDYVREIAVAAVRRASPFVKVGEVLLVTTGMVVLVAVVGVCLTFDILRNMYRWWHGEISGSRCSKNIIDSMVTLGAGVSGGVAGTAIGGLFGPIGSVVGGFFGLVLSAGTAHLFADRLTQHIFGIPRTEALENAYKYLGVDTKASDAEINTAFRRLCLKYHPDKSGGNAEEFHFLQLHMTTIKIARGEMHAGGNAVEESKIEEDPLLVLPLTEK